MNVRSALAMGVATTALTFGGLFGIGSTPVAHADSSAYCGTSIVNGTKTTVTCGPNPTTTVTQCPIYYIWGYPVRIC